MFSSLPPFSGFIPSPAHALRVQLLRAGREKKGAGGEAQSVGKRGVGESLEPGTARLVSGLAMFIGAFHPPYVMIHRMRSAIGPAWAPPNTTMSRAHCPLRAHCEPRSQSL